jgi:glucosylceramidase
VEGGTEKSGSHKVTRSGQCWAFAHFSRHIKRGAKVFATNGVAPDAKGAKVSYTGFVNPDGKHVLVVANRGGEQRAQLVLGRNAIELMLPADSVHTLEWS